MNKLEQAARQALEALPIMTEFFNRYVESIGGPYFNEADRIALMAVRELPRIEGALREALDRPKQDLDPAARNGWVLREVLFDSGEAVGHREPQVAAVNREQIREVFMAHGFTIKDGQTDLKQYVYDAAYALLAQCVATKPACQQHTHEEKLCKRCAPVCQ